MRFFMNAKTYTIGELSALSGIPVRRIRFYSDKGLLPPSARSAAGYRVYTESGLARLDLVRAPRDAGISLETIRKVLSRRLTLTDVLRMRLRTLEAEIASRRRIAAVLSATLRLPEPAESDLRRLWTMTTLSNAKLREMLEDLFDKVANGARADEAWKAQVIGDIAPELPDEPTPEQIDAWNEIVTMITDEAGIAGMRAEMASIWHNDFDPSAYDEASQEMLTKVRAAIEKGERPASAAGIAISREWLGKIAKAMKREPDEAFIAWARKHRVRSSRYRELLGVLRGDGGKGSSGREWLWINEAIGPLLAPAA
jgi:DNA-binding transcriptional MerR regulator